MKRSLGLILPITLITFSGCLQKSAEGPTSKSAAEASASGSNSVIRINATPTPQPQYTPATTPNPVLQTPSPTPGITPVNTTPAPLALPTATPSTTPNVAQAGLNNFVINCVHQGSGTDYQVGPGKAYANISDVPLENLHAGDTVRIFYRSTPYFERMNLTKSGTATQPIRICGVQGPNGELPIIDGKNAVSRPQSKTGYNLSATRGVILLSYSNTDNYGYKPSYIVIESLDVRNGVEQNQFTDPFGNTQNYLQNAAGIFVERGEHITVRGCRLNGNGYGFFVASGSDVQSQSKDILFEGNRVWGNGVAGNDHRHNIYTEALGTVIQYNYITDLIAGGLGSALKDRSAGTVIRYNWVEGGARILDLVESEDMNALVVNIPEYHKTHVYGNILVNKGTSAAMVHYGGDNGNFAQYRKGTLYFFNNTIIYQGDQTKFWSISLFDLSTPDENIDLKNNIIYVSSATAGAAPSEVYLGRQAGTFKIGKNVFANGVIGQWRFTPILAGSTMNGWANITFATPAQIGFNNVSAGDYTLSATSVAIDKHEDMSAEVMQQYPLNSQYMPHLQYKAKVMQGSMIDAGAFER